MDNKLGNVTSALSGGGVLTALTAEMSALEIIGIVIAIVSGLVSIGYTAFKWHRVVTAEDSDGGKSITLDELKSGIKEVVPVVKDVVDKVGNTKKGKE